VSVSFSFGHAADIAGVQLGDGVMVLPSSVRCAKGVAAALRALPIGSSLRMPRDHLEISQAAGPPNGSGNGS